MAIIAPIDRAERQRIHKAIQRTPDKGFARRLIAMLLLAQGKTIVAVSDATGAARSYISRWINWYTGGGIDALKSQPSGRPWYFSKLHHKTLDFNEADGAQKFSLISSTKHSNLVSRLLESGVGYVRWVSSGGEPRQPYVLKTLKKQRNWRQSKRP